MSTKGSIHSAMTKEEVEVQEYLQVQESRRKLRQIREKSRVKEFLKNVEKDYDGFDRSRSGMENSIKSKVSSVRSVHSMLDHSLSSSSTSGSSFRQLSYFTGLLENSDEEDIVPVIKSSLDGNSENKSLPGYSNNDDMRSLRSMREEFRLKDLGRANSVDGSKSSIHSPLLLFDDASNSSFDDDASKNELSYFKSLLDDSEEEDLAPAQTRDFERKPNLREFLDRTRRISSRRLSIDSFSEPSLEKSEAQVKGSTMNRLDSCKTFDKYLRSLIVAYSNNDIQDNYSIQSQQAAMILIEKIYPRKSIHINAWQLIESTIRHTKRNADIQTIYREGDYVEYLEPDMTWTLDVVRNVSKVTTRNRKETFRYNIGNKCHISPFYIRAPEEALRRIFGHRPWLWQQWALLKLEQKMRFQRDHHNDFETFDIPGYARSLWFEWLLDPRNEQFISHLSHQRIIASQIDLFDHMMKPFYILDDIRRNNGWDFSEMFSVYSYLSTFGTGFSLCLVCLAMQFIIPAIIVLKTLQEANYYHEDAEDGVLSLLEAMFCVNDNQATCSSLMLTTFIVISIQVLYVIKVNPDASETFRDVCGVACDGSKKSYSRYRSLRVNILERNHDRVGQLIGIFIETYMNTLYVYLVFAINLFNILNQASPTEVVLNALALQFVIRIDENYVKLHWWDNDRRWIKAGLMELYIQRMFFFRTLRSTRIFCNKFGIDEDTILSICGSDPSLFYNRGQASLDCDNLKFMDHNDKYEYYVYKKYAKEYGYNTADEKFKKQAILFGTIEHCLMKFWMSIKIRFSGKCSFEYGLFNRLIAYRTWSRWDKALYCCSVPNINALFELNVYGQPIVRKILERDKHSESSPFYNFSLVPRNLKSIAGAKRINAITFKSLIPRIAFSIYWGEYGRVVSWLINAMFEWLTHMVQLMFPFYNMFLFLFAFYCVNEPLTALSTHEEGLRRCNCQLVLSRDSCLDSFALSVYTNEGNYPIYDEGQINFSCSAWNEYRKNYNYDITLLISDLVNHSVSTIISNPSMLVEACGADPDIATETIKSWL